MAHMHTAIYKTLDYTKFMGETGPAVYPAGYVYVYGFLYKITNGGENIRLGIAIFRVVTFSTIHFPRFVPCNTRCGDDSISPIQGNAPVCAFFLNTFSLVGGLSFSFVYPNVSKVFITSVYSTNLCWCYSSISPCTSSHNFVHLSISLLFTYQKWTLGTIFMSLALSIKMNILLFFPTLLLILFEVSFISFK